MDELITRRGAEALGLRGRQCTATNRLGERCRRAPIVGGHVCVLHGGGTPGARRAARERLLALIEPAMDALLRALNSGDPCAHCRRVDDMSVVVRAATVVLDRTGFGPAATLSVEPAAQPVPWAEYLTGEEEEALFRIFEAARARMKAMDVGPEMVKSPTRTNPREDLTMAATERGLSVSDS